MENRRLILILTLMIALFAAGAALTGVLTSGSLSGGAPSGGGTVETVRGRTVELHGRGVYRHMSAEVAVQGVAQDWVTLGAGVPLLIAFALRSCRRRGKSPADRFVLAGVLGYFLTTYLFYLAMAAYNELFLVYAALLGLSFFALATVLLGLRPADLPRYFSPKAPRRGAGVFLMVNAGLIALLWLSVVVPPLLDGTLYPPGLAHYTTLIVQGFDLGLLLPLSFVSGWLLFRGRPLGFLLGPVYTVFLALLMTALTAKLIGMALIGVSAGPGLVIIPLLNLTAAVLAYRLTGKGVDTSEAAD